MRVSLNPSGGDWLTDNIWEAKMKGMETMLDRIEAVMLLMGSTCIATIGFDAAFFRGKLAFGIGLGVVFGASALGVAWRIIQPASENYRFEDKTKSRR